MKLFSVEKRGTVWAVVNPFGVAILEFTSEEAAKKAAQMMNGEK
jgi:RNA recognition motif-containing protein